MKGKKGQSKDTKLAEKYQDVEHCTTVMLRNIPSVYTQDELLQEVTETIGSFDCFDFFYLPWDFQANCNMTYGFVNFHDPQIAHQAVKLFSNYKFRIHESRKMGQVLPAHVQGLQNNLRHLQDRAIAHGNHPGSPIVMWKGQKIELSRITQDVLRKFRTPSQGKGFMDDTAVPSQSADFDNFMGTPSENRGACGGKGGGFLQPPASVPGHSGISYQVSNGIDPNFARILDSAADACFSGGTTAAMPPGSSSGGQQRTDPSVAKDVSAASKNQSMDEPTTVMVRNIPSKYTQDELLVEVSEVMGSADMFDFFYLPWDFQNNCNIGYAFVNFHDSSKAQLAVELLSNYKFRTRDSRRLGQVLPAHIQGLRNNLMHLQDRAVANGNHPCSPVVMWKGRKIELSKISHELKTRDALKKFRAPALGGRALDDAMTPGYRASPLSDGGRHPEDMGCAFGHKVPPASQPSAKGGTDFGTQEEFAAILDKAAGFDSVEMTDPKGTLNLPPSRVPPRSQGRGTMSAIREVASSGMDYSMLGEPHVNTNSANHGDMFGNCDFFEDEGDVVIPSSAPSEPSTGSAPSFKMVKAPNSSSGVSSVRATYDNTRWIQAPASAPSIRPVLQGGYFQAVEEPVCMHSGPQSQMGSRRQPPGAGNYFGPQAHSAAPGLSLPEEAPGDAAAKRGAPARPQAVPSFSSSPPPGLPADSRNVPEPNMPAYPAALRAPVPQQYGPVPQRAPMPAGFAPACPVPGSGTSSSRYHPQEGFPIAPPNIPSPSSAAPMQPPVAMATPPQTRDAASDGVLEVTVQNAHVDVLHKFLTKFGG